MTTIKLRKNFASNGLTLHILNSDEHPPAHAHVVEGSNPRKGPYCRIKLGGPGEVGDPSLDPVVWDVYGLSARQVSIAKQMVEAHITECWAEWRRFHGDKR